MLLLGFCSSLLFSSYFVIFVHFSDLPLLLLRSVIARTTLLTAQNFVHPFSLLFWESVMGHGIIKNSKAAFQNGSELTKSAELQQLT